MLPQTEITPTTPTGATLVDRGATFRVWAPRATAVYLNGIFSGVRYDAQTGDRLLVNNGGYWTGFQEGARDGDLYRFWIVGPSPGSPLGTGYKRDPYASELSQIDATAQFPNCYSVVRASGAESFPWHDAEFRTPDFSAMVVYQAHVGTYAISRSGTASNFLDVASKVQYLADLGVNVLQPLPVDEVEVNPSLGYDGADLFSPDFPYVAAAVDLPGYLTTVNAALAAKGMKPLTLANISSGPGQLKALIDLCHVYGIAVTLDVVYNHAGGFNINGGDRDDNCLYCFDRLPVGNNNDSLYFTDQDRGTGGLAFAMWNADVCQLLFDNARRFVQEFHADGFRYDQIGILLSTNQTNGWQFCRNLTTQLRTLQPRILQNAEFWPGEWNDIPATWQPIVEPAALGGAGFDVVQHDAFRNTMRGAVGAASVSAQSFVSMSSIAEVLYPPNQPQFDHAWRAVTCVENHDIVYAGRSPRIPWLADSTDRESWYARSRSRFATGILLTAPGIPQLFMGQEFLEDKQWSEQTSNMDGLNGPTLLWWDGLKSDIARQNHLRFTRELIGLRASQPALRGDNVNPFYTSNNDRVLAFHRWLEETGQDVVVVATLAEGTWWNYDLGFPIAGFWTEVFNSDVYDNWVNPWVAGNGAGVTASGPPMHGFQASASVVIPANGVVVFAKS